MKFSIFATPYNDGAAVAGGAAPAAATGNPSATPPASASAAPSTTDWTTGLADLDRGYIQNKGWKGPGDVVSGYQNLEKLVGVPADQIVKLPKSDDAGEWDQVYSRLGKPAKAEDYKLPEPKKGGNSEFTKWAQESFFKAGLTAKQANAVVEQWNATQEQSFEKEMTTYNQKVTEDQAALKKEWGLAHDQNTKVAQRAAQELGLTDQHFEALEKTLGLKETLKMFHQIGARTGESKFVEGSRAPGSIKTPEAARSEFNMLMEDATWRTKFANGDAQVRMQKEALERQMYPELQS